MAHKRSDFVPEKAEGTEILTIRISKHINKQLEKLVESKKFPRNSTIPRGSKRSMIMFYVSPKQLEMLNKIVDSNVVKNRSELLRRILDKYLLDYWELVKGFKVLTHEQIKQIGA